MKVHKLEMPEIHKHTPIGKEFRQIMKDLGIKIYSDNTF